MLAFGSPMLSFERQKMESPDSCMAVGINYSDTVLSFDRIHIANGRTGRVYCYLHHMRICFWLHASCAEKNSIMHCVSYFFFNACIIIWCIFNHFEKYDFHYKY